MRDEILRKLGYKPGSTVHCHHVPDQLAPVFGPLVASQTTTPETAQWSIWFVQSAQALEACATMANNSYANGGHLWFAYPKLSGKIKTDITRDKGWSALAPFDLLPVMQVALDTDWSALRFRRRAEIKKLTRKF
jgi:hypothetical protein